MRRFTLLTLISAWPALLSAQGQRSIALFDIRADSPQGFVLEGAILRGEPVRTGVGSGRIAAIGAATGGVRVGAGYQVGGNRDLLMTYTHRLTYMYTWGHPWNGVAPDTHMAGVEVRAGLAFFTFGIAGFRKVGGSHDSPRDILSASVGFHPERRRDN